ncbi:MAG: CidA/LrgA family protein [Rhodospirillaceae bacterium]
MKGFILLFAVAIAADAIAQQAHLPVPGSVLGMLALTTWFAWRKQVDPAVQDAAQTLLKHLALLLVPVGVAVVDLLTAFDGRLMLMVAVSIAALLLTTLTTIATIWLAQRTLGRLALA